MPIVPPQPVAVRPKLEMIIGVLTSGMIVFAHQKFESFVALRFKSVVGRWSLSTRSFAMVVEQYQVHLVRIDQSRNMARFYQLSIEPSLFGDCSVVRNWGRLGTRGQLRVALFHDRKSAPQHFLDITKEKKSRGYVPRMI